MKFLPKLFTPLRLIVVGLLLAAVTTVRAQTGDPSIAISRIDSQTYPDLTVLLSVAEADGALITDLSADAVRVAFSDGDFEVAPTAIVPSDVLPVSLVLAVDISTGSDAQFEQRIATVRGFLDSLAADDEVAILAFNETVRLIQPLTSDQEALNNALIGLARNGEHTYFHQAVFEAATLLNRPTGKPKGVIVLTDRAFATPGPTSQEVIVQAQTAGARIYAIGTVDNEAWLQPALLNELAQNTGGTAAVVASEAAAAPQLAAALSELRQGYAVTVRSPVEADDQSHRLYMQVTHAAGSVVTTGDFTARSRDGFPVAFLDLAAGDQVSGTVDLAIQTTPPGSVAAVDYLLDNVHPLGSVDGPPPYSITWDTTGVPAGRHGVVARVVDSVGNVSQAQVDLEVFRPIEIEIVDKPDTLQLGEAATLNLQVNAQVEIATFEILVDDKLVASPAVSDSGGNTVLEFVLDSALFSPGDHQLTVRAVDIQGRERSETFALTILPPPSLATPATPPPSDAETQPARDWARFFLRAGLLLAILATLGATIWLLWWLHRLLKRRALRWLYLEVANEGNAPNRYELKAHDAEQQLDFEFFHAGRSLHFREETRLVPATTPEAGNGYHRQPAPAPQPVAEGSPPRANLGQTVKQAKGISQALASIAGLLALMLPRSAGAGLRRSAQSLRRGQMMVQRGEQLQQRTGQVASLSGREATQPQGEPVAAVAAGPAVTPAAAVGMTEVTDLIVLEYAQTPTIPAGELLQVAVCVRPQHPFRRRDYQLTFDVVSLAAVGNVEEQSESAAPSLMSLQSRLDVTGLSLLWRVLFPALVILLGLGLTAFLSGLLVSL